MDIDAKTLKSFIHGARYAESEFGPNLNADCLAALADMVADYFEAVDTWHGPGCLDGRRLNAENRMRELDTRLREITRR